jgi:hypothetical protein
VRILVVEDDRAVREALRRVSFGPAVTDAPEVS